MQPNGLNSTLRALRIITLTLIQFQNFVSWLMIWNYEKRSVESQWWPWRNHSLKTKHWEKKLGPLVEAQEAKTFQGEVPPIQSWWAAGNCGRRDLTDSNLGYNLDCCFLKKKSCPSYLWRLVGKLTVGNAKWPENWWKWVFGRVESVNVIVKIFGPQLFQCVRLDLFNICLYSNTHQVPGHMIKV